MILVSGGADPVRRHLQMKFRSNGTLNRALLLDRDGVLNLDFGYVGRREEFRFVNSTLRLIRWGVRHGYLVIIVTNQSGIGRGFFSLQQFEALMTWVDGEVRASGGEISACYFSPAAPTHLDSSLKQVFERKPSPEMVRAAIKDFNLDASACILIGDNLSDVQAGRDAGIPNLLLLGREAGGAITEVVERSEPLAIHEPEPLAFVSRLHTCDGACREERAFHP